MTNTKYKTIFNIVNEDDIVPYMPIEYWGFKKYGRVKSISVYKYFKAEKGSNIKGGWEWLIGNNRYYNYDDFGGTQRTLGAFQAICDNREQIYIKDNTKEGIVRFNNIPHPDEAAAEREKNTAIKALSEQKLFRFSEVSIKKGKHLFGLRPTDVYFVYVNYSPAYLMQTLANMTAGVKPMTGQNLSGKYNNAKLSFIFTSGKISHLEFIGGMTDPHLPITYYLLSYNNKFM